jgi:DNA-damage-inducible protein D
MLYALFSYVVMSTHLTLFQNKQIRRHRDEEAEKRWFSVVDIVSIASGSADGRNYRKVLKNRLKKEWSEVVTNCNQLKILASDGKYYATDVADVETILRLIQSIPSPNAEPLKLRLAKVWYERMQETVDPALSIERARENRKKYGRSEKRIQQRMMGQETRNKLTDFRKNHDVKEWVEFAILTNIIHEERTGMSVKKHKHLKWLKSQNLRDHMSEAELIFTALAELSTRQIAEVTEATWLEENKKVSKEWWTIAKDARKKLEEKTWKSVITEQNFLPKKK